MAVKIKFCGLMRPADVACAVEAGAAYLGVVFAGGPRAVTPEQAKRLVAAGRGLPVLGVFAEQPVETILQVAEQTGLSGVQLHGPYSQGDAKRLSSAGLEVWRVVRIATPNDLDVLGTAIPGSHAVLVEPWVPHALGGSGVPLDLAIAREARARLAGHRMVLAGGLTPETVADALDFSRPDVVDVSSGVEAQPGIKDHAKIMKFAEAVFARSPIS